MGAALAAAEDGMAVRRVQPQKAGPDQKGAYAKNMYSCPAEWLHFVEARRAGDARVASHHEEPALVSERLKRRLHLVERRIDLTA